MSASKPLDFLLLASIGPNQADLVRAITDRGHTVHVFNLSDVTIRLGDTTVEILFGDRPLSSFDIIIPRTIQTNLSLGKFILQSTTERQVVLDHAIAFRDVFGKVAQGNMLQAGGLLHPKTLYIADARNLSSLEEDLSLPCIAKPVIGSQGYGVMLIKTIEEAEKLLQENPAGYLFQEYLPISYDYRILVVGEHVVGGIKRNLAKGDIRTNASVGGVAEIAELTEELRSTAIRAAALFGYNLAGVDIAVVGSKHYVFEVNRSPQWQAFKGATRIDPAHILVDYLLEQFANKKRA